MAKRPPGGGGEHRTYVETSFLGKFEGMTRLD